MDIFNMISNAIASEYLPIIYWTLFFSFLAFVAWKMAFANDDKITRLGVDPNGYRAAFRWIAIVCAGLSVAAVALSVAAAVAMRIGENFSKKFEQMGYEQDHLPTIAFTTLAGAILWAGLCALAVATAHGSYDQLKINAGATPLQVGRTTLVSRNLLMVLGGSLLGWGTAMVFAPFGDADRAALQSVWQGMSLLLSGFLLSKIDRLLEGTLFDATKAPTDAWIPFGLLIGSALLVLVVVFTHRMYSNPKSEATVTVTGADQSFSVLDVPVVIKAGELLIREQSFGKVLEKSKVRIVFSSRKVYIDDKEQPTQYPTVHSKSKTDSAKP